MKDMKAIVEAPIRSKILLNFGMSRPVSSNNIVVPVLTNTRPKPNAEVVEK